MGDDPKPAEVDELNEEEEVYLHVQDINICHQEENPMAEKEQTPTVSYDAKACDAAAKSAMAAETLEAAAAALTGVANPQWKQRGLRARMIERKCLPLSSRINHKLEEVPGVAGARNLLGHDPVSFGRNVWFIAQQVLKVVAWIRA